MSKQAEKPTGLWKRFFVLIPLVAVLALCCAFYISSVKGTYTVVGIESFSEEEFDRSAITFSNKGVVEVTSVARGRYGAPIITIQAHADGETNVSFGEGNHVDAWHVQVIDGGIREGRINFPGWRSILISVCILLAALVILFASVLLKLWRISWYGYEMVACGGGFLYFAFQLLLFVLFYARNSLRDFTDLAVELTAGADYFAYVSLPMMAILALLVSASNVSLIRHEGLRPVNLLGIGVSIVWMLANAIWFTSGSIIYDMLSSMEVVLLVDSIVASTISFGECLLLSTIVCASFAAHHTPSHGGDYLIILGCGIRPDGTPSPLLAGRVDKAYGFDQARIAHGDAPTTFVPSGGQGPDEVMSEAQSMCTYLVGKGVDRQRIILEDRSTTTRENMAYSRNVIEEHAGKDVHELSVVFSTTNYHVFRGYVCAHQAGMTVEGMGSKTRSYFWPNAFLREFIGLLFNQWRTILQTGLIIIVFYALAEYVLTFA